MEEHDDWKLGDEAEPVRCPGCGKANRAGLSYCTICGTALGGAEPTIDPGSLRTIGEAMGARRMPRQARRHPLRAWTIAAGLLLVIVVGLTWLATREEPFHLEDWVPLARATPPSAPPRAAVVAPTRVREATAVAPTATPRPVPTATETAPPPEPTAVRTAVRTAVPKPRRTPARPRPAVVPPVAAPTSRAPAVVPEEDEPIQRPRVEATEKPSLGSDLQEATRAYRQAVDIHNARVDEYNALADEVQRRNAWDDSEASVELRRRLDRAREAVETARVQAEMLRARMESVRARYR